MEQSQARSTVLVIDDNAENRALARATLEDEDYDVILAASGEEGIRAFEADQPDCILLDVRMPGMDGFAVCTRIRSLPGGGDVSIVFLTALRDLETFDRALRAGSDDFLTKPVRPAELVVRVQSALKLRRMGADLREHYDIVRRQRDDLMRLQLQKERLTAFVIHDLKNPLNSVDLHAQILLRDPELSDKSRVAVGHIRSGVRALLRLILNLLDISKGEEGQLQPDVTELDVDTLVTEVLGAHEAQAQSRSVTLSRSVKVRLLRADPNLLRRVLENLLDNALRHAPKDTEVRVSAEEEARGIVIRVADAGPGIPPELRERIFDRYVQLDAGERIGSGRGLGLTFCKLAIEAHGGDIWVEDGKPGSVFCMRLPHAQ
jgi:two-component system sensor histidine kinase/response regulator